MKFLLALLAASAAVLAAPTEIAARADNPPYDCFLVLITFPICVLCSLERSRRGLTNSHISGKAPPGLGRLLQLLRPRQHGLRLHKRGG